MKIFEHPRIKKLFDELYDKILDESGRGAILTATAYAEDFLTELIEEVLPDDLSRDQKKSIIRGSFYSKISSAYAFRLINKNLADSLHALRDVRNEAAHSATKFELHELNERMIPVYDLGPNIPVVVKNMATELIVGSKAVSLSSIFEERQLSEDQKRSELVELFEKSENIDIINKQLPYWELLTGISLLCGVILHSKEQLSKLILGIQTWNNLSINNDQKGN